MDPKQRVPLYRQVAETIKGRILDGKYHPGDLIPPLRELESEFEVSNITVRKALSLLNQEGLIETRQGVGTLVAKCEPEMVQIEITGNFREWLDSVSGKKVRLDTSVLEITQAGGPARIQEILGVEPGQKMFRMKRVRKFRGRPVAYFVNYSLLDGCRLITKQEVEKRTFIEVFQETCGIRLTHLEQRVRAITADLDLSAILEADFGAPLFFAENIYCSGNDLPVQVTDMYYRGDRHIYKAIIPLT